MEENLQKYFKMNELLLKNIEVVVVANGSFPVSEIPLTLLKSNLPLVCCDGAVENLEKHGFVPAAVVGDGDSVPQNLRQKYSRVFHFDGNQENNDLTKAVNYCVARGYKNIAIVGATGLREDHTLANISLLVDYSKMANCCMLTDYGVFTAISKTAEFQSFPQQQVSVFCMHDSIPLTFEGLQYPVENRCFRSLWEGSLNSATGNSFKIFTEGDVVVFQTYEPKGKV